jgi:hypothetical protein
VRGSTSENLVIPLKGRLVVITAAMSEMIGSKKKRHNI